MLTTLIRCLVVAVGVILQLAFAVAMQFLMREHAAIIEMIYLIISVLIILSLIKNSVRLSNDLPWIVLILIFPIFGSILLIATRQNIYHSKLSKSLQKTEQNYRKYLEQDAKIRQKVEAEQLDNLRYFLNCTGYPITKDNRIKYYDFGEKMYSELLGELKKAKKYIFMEYFIIKEGEMWNGILEILKKKAAEGVDVRILYDDVGSITMLSDKYPSELRKLGIKCIPFNKLSPFKGAFMNNRDHRKMTVVDGRVAFSGGVNMGDEYINLNDRLGVWKDNGIKVEGETVWNFVVMFLTIWNAIMPEDSDLEKFRYRGSESYHDDGLVVSYGLSPLSENPVGEDVYINMINSAREYLYIMTPYLIVDTDVINSLIRAAKRGVDVRIVVPGVPDKKIVWTLTTSYFRLLVDNGVKIYTFKEGFVHSKVFLADDERAVVGTINLDYRSLYLHFENAIYMEKAKAIREVKADFDQTFDRCKLLKTRDVKSNIIKEVWQSILRLFAPLF